jgi:hypothetical protein
MVDIEQWDLVRALVSASSAASYDKAMLCGGEVFLYLDVAEDQFVRHPGFADAHRQVRAPSDIRPLLDRGWIQLTERFDDGRSYFFVLTDNGRTAASNVPE